MFDQALLNNLYSSRVAVFCVCLERKNDYIQFFITSFPLFFILCTFKRLKTDENRGHSTGHSAVAYICSQKSANNCVTVLS